MKTYEFCNYFVQLDSIPFIKLRNCFDKELLKEKLQLRALDRIKTVNNYQLFIFSFFLN